jgi:hypothetical protein
MTENATPRRIRRTVEIVECEDGKFYVRAVNGAGKELCPPRVYDVENGGEHMFQFVGDVLGTPEYELERKLNGSGLSVPEAVTLSKRLSVDAKAA